MRILYIHQYFNTPDRPGGTRSYWISRELIKNGHEVTMLTSHHRASHNTSINQDRNSPSVQRYKVDGISVISLKVRYANKMGVLRRLRSYAHFMIMSTYISFKEKKVDLVIATSTPLSIGFPAWLLKKVKGIPYLFEVRDLWPEAPIQMGAIKSKLSIFLARWFERTIYKNANHIIALSPGMEEGVISAGINPQKVSMISNMAKIDKFFLRPKNEELMNQLNLDSKTFKIVYFGSLGLSNAIDYILDAAKIMTPNKEIEFIFLGYGVMVSYIEERIKRDNLNNVRFIGSFAMNETAEIVNICDVSLVTFKNLPILATNSPNKLFDSLSAGKPIIVNSAGWTKSMVEKNECGIFVDPENPQDFADKVYELKNQPALLERMGSNSRKLAESQYDKSILCEKFARIVNAQKIE